MANTKAPRPMTLKVDVGPFNDYISNMEAVQFDTKGERTRFRLKVAALLSTSSDSWI